MSDGKLEYLLALQAENGGSIPFERWMREALYHERYGYYTTAIRGLGRGGDFTTWPQREKNLARAIARWARAVKPSGSWHLIEVGAGSGELAAAVLAALGWWGRPRLHVVEISPVLRAAQQKRLGGKARWHDSMADALAACEGRAIIYSNELVDAFPCRIFARQNAAWRELALRIEGGRIAECWREAELPDATAFDREWPEGQRVEVQTSYREWLAEWQPHWKSGAMLTIDYGDAIDALYHRRPHGTLRAYAHHQRLEGAAAYGGFGVRDLTVDVNFSDLQRWSGEGELLQLGAFLARHGEAAAGEFAAAGEAFQVLIQAR